jgi:polyphosphate glucokinase
LYIEKLFYPDLFIIGGGTSKKFDKFESMLNLSTPVVPAKLLNDAGIIGAAMFAHQ